MLWPLDMDIISSRSLFPLFSGVSGSDSDTGSDSASSSSSFDWGSTLKRPRRRMRADDEARRRRRRLPRPAPVSRSAHSSGVGAGEGAAVRAADLRDRLSRPRLPLMIPHDVPLALGPPSVEGAASGERGDVRSRLGARQPLRGRRKFR